jgi:hypothetical protein
MKAAVIIFHKNIERYPAEWVRQCTESIYEQAVSNWFDVFELNYGGWQLAVYPNSKFFNDEYSNHAEAHNYLLDRVFEEDYDCAFNVNIDDYYHPYRFALQIKAIEQGYDVVSSNFYRVDAQGHNIGTFKFDHLDPAAEAKKGHNIIAHPVCCYSRNFWLNCSRLNPAEIPADDFELWKRSYGKFKFTILPEFLLYQRIHDFNVSKK